MNLVYRGMPITGSWGGDCEELARQYYGQADDAAGYAEAMRASFNIDDDGTLSRFSNGGPAGGPRLRRRRLQGDEGH